MRPLRLLVVDDQTMFVQSMKVVLESSDLELEEVLTARSGEEALAVIDKRSIDVVLLDVHMPGMDGLETLKRIRAERPDARVVMLSAFGYEEYVREALGHGARGYLLKDETPELVISSIRHVYEGGIVLSDHGGSLFQGKPADPPEGGKVSPAWLAHLSERERKILYLISLGKDNEEIAEELNMAYQTTRNYVSTIYRKLGISNRFMAIRIAIEARISEYIVNL
jgi:DNA-binding NarL/FixJ family response regulator